MDSDQLEQVQSEQDEQDVYQDTFDYLTPANTNNCVANNQLDKQEEVPTSPPQSGGCSGKSNPKRDLESSDGDEVEAGRPTSPRLVEVSENAATTENEVVRSDDEAVGGEDLDGDLGEVGGEGQEDLSATALEKAGGLTAASRPKSNRAVGVSHNRVVPRCCEFEDLFEEYDDCEIPATTTLTIAQENNEKGKPKDVSEGFLLSVPPLYYVILL